MYTALPIDQMGLAIAPTYPRTDAVTKHAFNYRMARYAEQMDPETPPTIRKFDSSMMWVKEELEHHELISLDEILAKPAPALGIEYYIKETLSTIGLLAMEHEHKYLLDHINAFLDDMVHRIEEELIKIHNNGMRGAEKTNCMKPVDLSRLYLRPVMAAKHFHAGCQRVFCDLSILPTVPQLEVTNPGWVDSYTGEFEATDDMVTVSDTGITDVSIDHPEADDCVVVNGMTLTRKEFKQYLDAQKTGFDPIMAEDEPFDEWDVLEKDFQFQNDLKIDFDAVFEIKGQIGRGFSRAKWNQVRVQVKQAVKELSDSRVERMKKKLRAEHRFLGKTEFKKRCKAIYKRAKNSPQIEELRQKLIALYPGNSKELMAWLEQNMNIAMSKAKDEAQAQEIAHARFLESPMFTWLIDSIQSVAETTEPQNLLTAIMKWQNEWALWEEDLENIHVAGWDLASWFSMNEDQILEQLNDLSPAHLEIDDKTLDEFDTQTVTLTTKRYAQNGWNGDVPTWEPTTEYAKQIKELWTKAQVIARKKRRKDLVTRHPAFVEAQLRAALNGSSQPDQISMGWEAFREAVCPKGNEAYHKARNNGKTNPEAMKMFWSIAYGTKAIKPYIDNLNQKGVTLSNGHVVPWSTAAEMLKKNELDVTPDERKRIRQALEGRSFASQFVEAL